MTTGPASVLSSRGFSIFFAVVVGLFTLTMFLFLGIAWGGHPSPRQTFFGWCFRLFPLSQFILIAPIASYCYRTGRTAAMQGWLIGAALAAVLFAPCWGWPWIVK
jgi:hypothetical protein